MIKKSYTVELSYNVSDAEKELATKALLYFTHAIKKLVLASDHLNLMKTPFKDSPEINSKQLLDSRAAVRRFRDKSIENFNIFKQIAFKCINSLQSFSSDTQTIKLMKSFIASVDDLEYKVNKFIDLFNDLEDKDFAKNIVENIEAIQTQCDEIEKFVDDRIKSHIQKNILAASWVDSVSQDLQVQIEQKRPLILDLFNKTQDQLNDAIKEKGIR